MRGCWSQPSSRPVSVLATLVSAMAVAAASPAAAADATAEFFRQNCASCHTIGGGRLTGPDLKGVTGRRDRSWLERFVQNPKAVLDSGDAYALELQREARGVVMPTVPGLTPERVKALVSLIEEHSKLAQSPFANLGITDRPFVAADVALGTRLFLGLQPLANRGPACVSCHGLATITGSRRRPPRPGPDACLRAARRSQGGGRVALGAEHRDDAGPLPRPRAPAGGDPGAAGHGRGRRAARRSCRARPGPHLLPARVRRHGRGAGRAGQDVELALPRRTASARAGPRSR